MLRRFEKVTGSDIERLALWIAKETWPYHARAQVDASWFLANAVAGYIGEDANAFWVFEESAPLGVVRVFDLSDITPLIDLRLTETARAKGIGTQALDWITRFVFDTYPEKVRGGGYTRHDNLPMRRVFAKCGYVQEAYHRKSWRVEGSDLADSVGYAILRCDWESGITTPIP
jgi:RimJ/RimL family protein N-acetyltransferase